LATVSQSGREVRGGRFKELVEGAMIDLHETEERMDAEEPQDEELSLFDSGVILAGCVLGMAIMLLLAWIF
jgi:hypothetical protein